MNSSREKENITIEITTGTIVRAILLGLLLVFDRRQLTADYHWFLTKIRK